MDTSRYDYKMRSLFNVESDVNLAESYTETWAKIVNCCFCSYFMMVDKYDETEFFVNFEFIINKEKAYSLFQLVKILEYMKLSYNDLISRRQGLREMYKEQTNVLAYYIITGVLMNNYQEFLYFCYESNTKIFQFKNTNDKLNSFCLLIENLYKKKELLKNINCVERMYKKHKSSYTRNKTLDFVLNNTRMTISEMG